MRLAIFALFALIALSAVTAASADDAVFGTNARTTPGEISAALGATPETSNLVFPTEPAWHEYVVTQADLDAANCQNQPKPAKGQKKCRKQSIYTCLFGKGDNNVSRFNRRGSNTVEVGTVLRVPEMPNDELYTPLPAEYPPAKKYRRYVVVDLSRQFLGGYEYGKLVRSYPIASGTPEFPTRPGLGTVMNKVIDARSGKYRGPDGRGLPMPFAQKFNRYEQWMHAGRLPGAPASHGCVRMFRADAQKLYRWTGMGTPVLITTELK